jgi:glycosyltransferase involved in cell wall biosynthesis
MANLLHISSNVFPPLNEEHSTKKIWRELSKGFNEYHILARSKDNKFHNYQEGNIYLHLVPKLGSSKSFFLTSIVMLGIIKKYKIDLMLSQCPLFGGVTAATISKITKIPLMIEIHGMIYFSILDSNKIIDKILAKLIRYSFRNANKVRTLSNTMTDMLCEREIIANAVIIPNRVNTQIFNLPKMNLQLDDPIKVVSVGRFVWEKSFETAIEAVKKLHKKYNIELTLIGGGPLYEKYAAMADGCKYIHLVSYLPQEDFVPLLNLADIYIQPSISEGMPRTILEAMAMRLPVISSNVGAISGIISDRKNGILIKGGDSKDLEDAIDLLIKDEPLRITIATNGYDDVISKYEWAKVFEKYRSELNHMLE